VPNGDAVHDGQHVSTSQGGHDPCRMGAPRLEENADLGAYVAVPGGDDPTDHDRVPDAGSASCQLAAVIRLIVVAGAMFGMQRAPRWLPCRVRVGVEQARTTDGCLVFAITSDLLSIATHYVYDR
jgi:hypothetical protein